MNLLRATVVAEADGLVCLVGGQRLALPIGTDHALNAYVGRTVALGIRPEHMRDAALARDSAPEHRLRGKVSTTELLGSDLLVHVEVDAEPIITSELIEIAEDVDASAVDGLRAEARAARTLMICRLDVRSNIRVDDPVEVALSPERFLFFDIDTGLAVGAPTASAS